MKVHRDLKIYDSQIEKKEKIERLKKEKNITISRCAAHRIEIRKGAFSQFLVNAFKTFRVTKEQTGKEFNFTDVPPSKSSRNQLKIYSSIPSPWINPAFDVRSLAGKRRPKKYEGSGRIISVIPPILNVDGEHGQVSRSAGETARREKRIV